MTREEAILWLNEELRTWENECQSKHPIKEALYMACKALEQEPNTWSLDDAREDFMHDVYNTLDFLPTNEEANRIIDSFDRVTSSIEQEPRKLEQEHDKPMVEIDLYSVIKQKYIEREVLDKIRAEIMQLDYDIEFIDYDYNDMAQTEEVHTIYREEVLQIIDKYKSESEGK